MKKFLFWLGYHWMSPAIVLVVLVALQILCTDIKTYTWWDILLYTTTHVMIVWTSTTNHREWKRVYRKKYMEM